MAGDMIDFQKFAISFDARDKNRVFDYWNEIFSNQKWTEGKFTALFEEKWSKWNDLPSVAMSSWAGGALACLEYFKLAGKTVLCPTNTFMATPLSVVKANANILFADSNREDLCLSYDALVSAARRHEIAAVWLVHIGGHIAFDTPRIAEFCRSNNIILLEDCAHAHGASWKGQKPGNWGDAGVYSFYATKSITTGEGGMLVSKNNDLIEFAKAYRNYGKFDHKVQGLNYRMSEFTAAMGAVQTDRLEQITAWKNDMVRKYLDNRFEKRVRFPEGMTSGFYKYIVFEPVEKSTGKVYDQLCHNLLGHEGSFPNAEWISRNHWCVPLYYHPE